MSRECKACEGSGRIPFAGTPGAYYRDGETYDAPSEDICEACCGSGQLPDDEDAQPEPEPDDFDRAPEVCAGIERFRASLPAEWIPLWIEYEPGYPEDVAFGPRRMMERLKKWLDRYFALRLAPRDDQLTAAYAEGRKDERETFADLLKSVESILDAGHMNTEDLGRLRAAWEAL